MRKHAFVGGEYYHIYSHSVGDTVLFKSDADYQRFMVGLFLANNRCNMPRMDRVNALNLVWGMRDGKAKVEESLVDIVGFCFMPTHFHLLLKEKSDGNISLFLHRILVSYSKYFNLKYDRRGHVFERTFNSKHIADTKYLTRLSGYIHLNPKSLKGWKKREHKYEWSSYQDYIGENRWGKLLQTNDILDYFDNSLKSFKDFIEEIREDDDEEYDINVQKPQT